MVAKLFFHGFWKNVIFQDSNSYDVQFMTKCSLFGNTYKSKIVFSVEKFLKKANWKNFMFKIYMWFLKGNFIATKALKRWWKLTYDFSVSCYEGIQGYKFESDPGDSPYGPRISSQDDKF